MAQLLNSRFCYYFGQRNQRKKESKLKKNIITARRCFCFFQIHTHNSIDTHTCIVIGICTQFTKQTWNKIFDKDIISFDKDIISFDKVNISFDKDIISFVDHSHICTHLLHIWDYCYHSYLTINQCSYCIQQFSKNRNATKEL